MGKKEKLRRMSGSEVAKILEHNSFRFHKAATHGDLYFHTSDLERKALVPMHGVIADGTLSAIIRSSGKDREEFT